MKKIVKCDVGPGVFDRERSFVLSVGGRIFSGFVDEQDTEKNGLKVRVIECENDNCLIEFPRESANGQRAWVPKALLA